MVGRQKKENCTEALLFAPSALTWFKETTYLLWGMYNYSEVHVTTCSQYIILIR